MAHVARALNRRCSATRKRSGYGTTSVALNSTVKCSADRSAIGTNSHLDESWSDWSDDLISGSPPNVLMDSSGWDTLAVDLRQRVEESVQPRSRSRVASEGGRFAGCRGWSRCGGRRRYHKSEHRLVLVAVGRRGALCPLERTGLRVVGCPAGPASGLRPVSHGA